MELGNPRNLIALDLDSSDNLSDDALYKFLSRHGQQLSGLVLSGMPHITDQLWMSVMPILNNAKYVAAPGAAGARPVKAAHRTWCR